MLYRFYAGICSDGVVAGMLAITSYDLGKAAIREMISLAALLLGSGHWLSIKA